METLGLYAGLVIAVLTALGLFVRFIAFPLFVRPAMHWFTDNQVKPILEPMAHDVSEIRHLVTYHLGANGTTPPVRDRILLIESDVKNVKEDIGELKHKDK